MAADEITDVAVVALPLRTEVPGHCGARGSYFPWQPALEPNSAPFIEYEDDEAAQWLAGAVSWANDPLPSSFRQSIPVNATLLRSVWMKWQMYFHPLAALAR